MLEKNHTRTKVLDVIGKEVSALKLHLMKVFPWHPQHQGYLRAKMMTPELKMAEINQIHGVFLVIVVIIILIVAVLQMKIIAQISILCVLNEKHCIWQKTKYYIIDLKLNNGNEKTFWFNLILLMKVINIFIIFGVLNQIVLKIILKHLKLIQVQ